MIEQADQLFNALFELIGAAIILYAVVFIVSAAWFNARYKYSRVKQAPAQIIWSWNINVKPETPPEIVSGMVAGIEKIMKDRGIRPNE